MSRTVGDLEDTVADRDPEAIKQDIDHAREELAATVDSLAERANPRRLADDLKARVVEFVKKPVVIASLVGISSVVVVVVVRRIRDR
jgi:small ligand-binding sensory domain FIST